MMQFLFKVIVSALLIAAIAEIGKRNTLVAAVLASLPVTSLLAFIWLYRDTGDRLQVAALSQDIFWLVLPSLLLFVLLPLLLRHGWQFWTALATACLVTGGGYATMMAVLRVLRAG